MATALTGTRVSGATGAVPVFALGSLQIQGIAADKPVRDLLVKLNAGTASALDISGAQISLGEKAICRALLDGTATRAGIEAQAVSLPIKAIALAIAKV